MALDWDNLPKESTLPTLEEKERDEEILQLRCTHYDYICEVCKLKEKKICGYKLFISEENFKKKCKGYANVSECIYFKVL